MSESSKPAPDDKAPPFDDVLRRMLQSPPKPKKDDKPKPAPGGRDERT